MKGNTMATMRNHYGKWQTIVRIKGHPTVYKSFDQKTDAKRNEKLLTEFHKERLEGNLVAGVMAQLLDRDLSKFNPLGMAPWTKFRDLMHDLADKPVNDYIKESFDQGVYPFDRELITTTETFSWLKERSQMHLLILGVSVKGIVQLKV
jgi:hypothetical protein